MTARTTESIHREVANLLAATFPDRDFPPDAGAETRVFADLGLASIDVVVLGERLEQYYGKRLPFGPFLAGLRAKGADDLTLGDVIAFLQRHV